MRRHLLRGALTSLLAASAVTGLVPTASADPPPTSTVNCDPLQDAGVAVLGGGDQLAPGASLTSLSKTTSLVMQPDGNLVLYAVTVPGGPKHALWSSKTSGHPGAYAVMQLDGNLVVYRKGGGAKTGGALWSSKTYGATNAKVRLSSDGELTVWGDEGPWGPKWSSMTHEFSPTRCAPYPSAPYQSMWAGDWAQSATVWMVLQTDGNLVIYRKRDNKAIWNSGTRGKDTWTLDVEADGDVGLHPRLVSKWLWHTGTGGNYGAYALLQDDGNFVVYRKGGGPKSGGALWSSRTSTKN